MVEMVEILRLKFDFETNDSKVIFVSWSIDFKLRSF